MTGDAATTRSTPTVSVIIPVRDDPRLRACVDAVLRQTYPIDRMEIIVVDNGSTTPVADALADLPQITCVLEPSGGSYTARNAAVAVSSGSVLAFTDADCLPDPKWIAEAVAALASGADIVAGHVEVYARDGRRPHPVEAYELVHAFPQEVYVQRSGASVTANLTTTRAVFETTGPFRSELYSGADMEWCQRANALGMHTVYRPGAVVRHPARDSFADLNAKLSRVISGQHDRDVLDGAAPGAAPWPTLRSLVPPIGAFRRARAPELTTQRARAAFVVGEFYHRYASAWYRFDLARRTRLGRRR